MCFQAMRALVGLNCPEESLQVYLPPTWTLKLQPFVQHCLLLLSLAV